MAQVDIARIRASVDRQWQESIVERLTEYVRIPNKSPHFDPDWERHGYMEAAASLIADWCRQQPVEGMKVEVRRLPGLTPVVLVDVPGDVPDCVLMYGHLDKQPEFSGWLPGLGPWEPVIRDGKLYGRGGADDGYAAFSSLAAIVALKEQKVPLPRCVILIEASEESGSIHLPAHLKALGTDGLGQPSLVICLDAEAGNYEQVWCTTSLRGVLVGELRIRMLTEGVHSGMATGIAATPFRIAEQLLARLENPVTGDILVDELHVNVPADRRAQIATAAKVLGSAVQGKVPFAEGVQPVSNDPVELLINSTWRATLAVTGADGLPPVQNAGNVLLPEVTLKLSMRLPPTTDPARATAAVKAALERDPPYGAQVTFTGAGGSGWNAPPFAPWLEESISSASNAVFGKEAVSVGSGGTIPFLGMLAQQFPSTQFFVTGVLGPQSNAHGPNEFLHIEYARKLTACVALVLADHAARSS